MMDLLPWKRPSVLRWVRSYSPQCGLSFDAAGAMPPWNVTFSFRSLRGASEA